jgi:hypothetical protein
LKENAMSAQNSASGPGDDKAAIAAALNTFPATSIHSGAITIALAAAGYFVFACWVTFAGGETSLVLAVVTLTLGVMFALLACGGALSRTVEPHRRSTRSFGEFLNGDVDIESGRITGRAALLQIAAMPVILALGGTLILGSEVWANDTRATTLSNVVVNSVSRGGTTLRSVDVEFPARGQMFPGGDKAEAINNNCLACHSAGMVLTQPKLSRAQWQSEVDKMRKVYQAPVAKEDEPAIVEYLASRGS